MSVYKRCFKNYDHSGPSQTMALLLLLLLPLAHARLGINVDISAGEDNVTTYLLGEDDNVITDDEISTFRLTDSSLKDAVAKFSGKRPTDAFLRSPTPWGDLYKSYGWKQVHRVLKPTSVTILGIRSEPVIIATQEFKNQARKTAQYKAELSQSVSNTVSNSWSSGNTINVGQEISYQFTIPGAQYGGKTTFSYSHAWGKSGTTSQAVTIGASAGVTVPVDPGQTVIASMTASRGTMDLEVTYEASLYGDVAANYAGRHNGHYFWKYVVNNIMIRGGLPLTVSRTEIVKVGFYTDVQIVLKEGGSTRALKMKSVKIEVNGGYAD